MNLFLISILNVLEMNPGQFRDNAVVFRTNSCWARWDEARKGELSFLALNSEVHKGLIARTRLL